MRVGGRVEGGRGRCLGLLDNGKRNARELLEALAEELQESMQVEGVVIRSKPSSSLPASEVVLEELAGKCKAVVAGVGD
jgi:hypothetical protein